MLQKTSRWDVEAPETLKSLGSFKVLASISEAATSRLGLVLDKILNILVSSQRHGSRVSVSKGLVCIPVDYDHQDKD